MHRSTNAAGVLLREESLGNDDVEIDAEGGGRNCDQQCHGLMAEHQLQSTAIQVENGLEPFFAVAIDAAVLLFVG